jgi:hypothetical protein
MNNIIGDVMKTVQEMKKVPDRSPKTGDMIDNLVDNHGNNLYIRFNVQDPKQAKAFLSNFLTRNTVNGIQIEQVMAGDLLEMSKLENKNMLRREFDEFLKRMKHVSDLV